MEPLLLCVQLDQEKLTRLSFLALGLGIRVRPVKKEEWGQPLGALCGLLPFVQSAPGLRIPDEMLVMAGFPDGLLDAFLRAYRESGLAPVRLKAVLTDTNMRWHFGQLHAQLCQEAAFFAARGSRG